MVAVSGDLVESLSLSRDLDADVGRASLEYCR